jgi:acetylornithine/succinyldiaminopimelate/putrescine aminotransferase
MTSHILFYHDCQVSTTETCAVIIEPVLGEGGYVAPPKAFLKFVRQFCTQHGIIMIADEVQTGVGRTGRM